MRCRFFGKQPKAKVCYFILGITSLKYLFGGFGIDFNVMFNYYLTYFLFLLYFGGRRVGRSPLNQNQKGHEIEPKSCKNQCKKL